MNQDYLRITILKTCSNTVSPYMMSYYPRFRWQALRWLPTIRGLTDLVYINDTPNPVEGLKDEIVLFADNTSFLFKVKRYQCFCDDII